MSEIDVRTLEQFSTSDFNRIVTGYSAQQTYDIHKVETDDQTAITLTLRALDAPFVKTYQHGATQITFYRSLLRARLSVGAYHGKRLIGLGIADRQDWNGTLILWEFHVEPSYRRQGIGRRMMDTLAATAAREYLRAISAETQNTNVPAIHFYRKVGFTLDSIDLSFYGNDDLARGEVAVFMKRRV